MEPAELVRKMNGVARVLRGASDIDGTLAAIAKAASTVPDADLFALAWVHDDGLDPVAQVNSELASSVTVVEQDAGEGPATEAARDRKLVWSDDVRVDTRWPLAGPAFADIGWASALSVPLLGDQGTLATITWWARDADVFGEDSRQVAELMASRAAASLSFATTVETLSDALDSRGSIGAAIGIVMERYGLDRDAAFRFLVRLSQNGNVKLRTVAEKLVESQEADIESSSA